MYYCTLHKTWLNLTDLWYSPFKILYNSRIVAPYIYTVADVQLKVSKK